MPRMAKLFCNVVGYRVLKILGFLAIIEAHLFSRSFNHGGQNRMRFHSSMRNRMVLRSNACMGLLACKSVSSSCYE